VVRGVLAAESCCDVADLSGIAAGIFVRRSRRGEDARCRTFVPPPLDIGMVSLGLGTIVSASSEAVPLVEDLFSGAGRDAISDPHRLGVLAGRLRGAGHRLVGPVPRFTVDAEDFTPAGSTEGVVIEIREPPETDDIQALDWPHALMRRRGEQCPLKLVAIAHRGGTFAGVASAIADGNELWQIGIDIAQGAQGLGIGQSLASAITEAVLDQGVVPYWCTNPANLRSIRTALSIGYKPAWLEVFTKLEPVELVPVTG